MTSELDKVLWKITFLRSMIPIMSIADLETFSYATKALIDRAVTVEHLKAIDELYKKFEEKV